MKVFIRIVPAALVWVAVAASISGQAPGGVRPSASADATAGRQAGQVAPAPTPARAPAPMTPTSTRAQAAAAAEPAVDPAFLKTYCVTCHNERMKANFGNLALDGLNVDHIGDEAVEFE